MVNIEAKRVFISYSWAVKDQVLVLANNLIRDGVEVIIDVYDLKEGDDKYVFMERSVNDDSIDYVLMMCDRTYAEKANARTGGVGDETVIITPSLYGDKRSERFIPIVLEKDDEGNAFSPAYVKSKIYIDLSDDEIYAAEYEKLLRLIYEKPSMRKPALGKMPERLNDEVLDYSGLRGMIYSASQGKQSNADFGFSDEAVSIMQKFMDMDVPDCDALMRVISYLKDFRDLIIDYYMVFVRKGNDVVEEIVTLLECLHNDIEYDIRNSMKVEIIGYFLWELFISIVAMYLHFRRYEDIYSLLTHSYLFRTPYSNDIENYGEFYYFARVIEGQCKPKSDSPDLLTLQGDILVHREHKPVITEKTLSDADLLLHHLYPFYFPGGGYWFPILYIYSKGALDIWSKLQSRSHCDKIMSLLEINSIEELTDKISKNPYGREMKYERTWEGAPWITNNIDVDKIGKNR